MRGPTPPKRIDESGECRHLYLTRDATCVHCGMRFRLAWSSEKGELIRPATRNLAFAAVAVILLVVTQLTGLALGSLPVSSLFLMVAVLFFTRTLLGGFELYSRHGFVPGKLGGIVRRGRFNPLPPKPWVTTLGAVRFPIDLGTYQQFQLGDTLLIEHLRWSRLPVAIYQGHLDSASTR
jgi:hypothetical protein